MYISWVYISRRVTLYKTKFPQERSYQDGALTETLTISYILESPIKKGLLVDSD